MKIILMICAIITFNSTSLQARDNCHHEGDRCSSEACPSGKCASWFDGSLYCWCPSPGLKSQPMK